MAIAFARTRAVGRNSGGNACCSFAYNARSTILDNSTGVTYNFSNRSDNLYHEILLPKGADESFKNESVLSNEIERIEKRKDSQLCKEYVLALPDDKEVTFEQKKEMIFDFIKLNGWVEKGFAVQVDIHAPDAEDKNWHAHLLIPTRKFTADGKKLFITKATDLWPDIKAGFAKLPFVASRQTPPGKLWAYVQNTAFERLGLDVRVDMEGAIAQEHIGPFRLRGRDNRAELRNREVVEANILALDSGEALLNRVTMTRNIFRERDLIRGVRYLPDEAKANALVQDALASKDLVTLYDDQGDKTEFYTTKAVRKEEQRLVRLSMWVSRLKSVTADKAILQDKDIRHVINAESKAAKLNNEQKDALDYMLKSDCGIRVIRGRAGTGKSRVLKSLAAVSKEVGIKTILIAPTHKAKMELEGHFAHTNTVAGLLHGIKHGQVALQKGSLIVVDEAGMVDDNAYSELMRVALNHRCNLVLAGDERQLSAIGRGGSFENFADKFGSRSLVDIQRQKEGWGRQVALCFSKKQIKEGVAILHQHNKLRWSADSQLSIKDIVKSWNQSKFGIKDRLVIAITNESVNNINQKIRDSLKEQGQLTGDEIAIINGNQVQKVYKEGKSTEYIADIMPKSFMKGDRIIFNKTNKDLGLSNGEFGTIEYVDREEFVVRLDNVKDGKTKTVTFDPSEFSGFTHGYASTVYKAQGASIKDVYVMHDGFSTKENSYVALSRHIDDLHLYCNKESTMNNEHLIKQLGFSIGGSSSLTYLTADEVSQKQKYDYSNSGLISRTLNLFGRKVLSFALNKIEEYKDKHVANEDYYQYEKEEHSNIYVEKILQKIHDGVPAEDIDIKTISDSRVPEEIRQSIAVGENSVSISDSKAQHITANNDSYDSKEQGSKPITQLKTQCKTQFKDQSKAQTAKERFYAKKEFADLRAQRIEQNQKKKEQWNADHERLKHSIKFKAESIAINLLGEPNKTLSNRSTLRFGNKGSIIVAISGAKAGTWYDFSEHKGGDLFKLVQEKHSCDFKGAAEYLKNEVGLSTTENIVDDIEYREKYIKYQAAKREEQKITKAKERKVSRLINKSKAITGETVVAKYLTNHRKINLTTNNQIKQIAGDDLKTTNIWRKEIGKSHPALIAFARNEKGEITGGQELLLNAKTNNKADIAAAKKSFGKIAGSFVTIGEKQLESNKLTITVIAEGIETALSIKQAYPDLNVVCSLGISNIKNYPVQNGEHIIIAADNDGISSNTNKVIEEAHKKLSDLAHVTVVRPSNEGDFNDILQDKGNKAGVDEIKTIFTPALQKHADIEKDRVMEGAYIISELAKMKEAQMEGGKQEANTLDEVIKAIANEQQFLAKKVESLSYTNHDPKLMQKMQSAYQNMLMTKDTQHEALPNKGQIILAPNPMKTKAIQDLQYISKHVLEKETMSKDQLTQYLKSVECPREAHKTLVKKYQQNILDKLNHSIKKISQGKAIEFNNQQFKCKIKLLEHVLEVKSHEDYFPKESLQKGLNQMKIQKQGMDLYRDNSCFY
ncbi:MAG: hypothetical protein DGJ47_000642 [Rickettsiaceae bacterium]